MKVGSLSPPKFSPQGFQKRGPLQRLPYWSSMPLTAFQHQPPLPLATPPAEGSFTPSSQGVPTFATTHLSEGSTSFADMSPGWTTMPPASEPLMQTTRPKSLPETPLTT